MADPPVSDQIYTSGSVDGRGLDRRIGRVRRPWTRFGLDLDAGQERCFGLISALGEDNVFAWVVPFTDGTSALYRWNLSSLVDGTSAVPEPSG